MFITKADPVHIANVWQRVRAMFVRVADIVGAIPALAMCAALTGTRRREIASRIALVESIVRKLIFIEAAKQHRAAGAAVLPDRPLRVEVATSPPRSRSAARSKAFDPTQPQTWSVRFNLAPPRVREASRAPRRLWGATLAPRQRTPEPLRLALRLEALRRALADPAPHARRLARILLRRCRRYRNAAERYAVAAVRPSGVDPGDPRLVVEVIALALCVSPQFLNSG